MQLFARPRDADKQQPAFFLQHVLVFAAPLVRQQAFFHRDDEHNRELQPLRGVQGHQRHAVVVRLPGVGFVDQAGLFQEGFQGALARIVLVELAGRGEQFLDVGQPLLILFVLRIAQHLLIARFTEHMTQNLFDPGGGHQRQPIVERHEFGHRDRRALIERLDQPALARGIQQ